MKVFKYIIAFLIINFGALAIGSWLMNNGPRTDWYQNLNQAPWTPPGWVFGVAWSIIMICFSVYMAYLYKLQPNTKLKILFTIQFALNVIWNYIFFNRHLVFLGFICIILLTIIVGLFLFNYKNHLKLKSLLILPYFIWLCIATSLNAYILFNN
ncbi:TspO/MBR family protein [Thalassobellus suaedae]|uniref:TspO/MBR family protein n=1 Tax=Thalassobellus suaedae TaxID=3074124 RepID=A0ABY9Y107_9FLAO|nr:TspO/MBR family protein [Flavobacteriaceae bacterium HL-DH10]